MSDLPIKVLLVEDNPGDARLLQEFLAEGDSSQFELAHVTRLSAGLKRLAEGGIDVVLLDLMLPDSSGLETFSKVHAHTPGTPIILLTGVNDGMLALQAVRQGAQDYLVKGQVDGNSLARAMLHAIERARLLVHMQAAQAVEHKPPGPSSHDRILEAAKHLFATAGYENTSTVAIARRAGTSESQIIKHFSGKEGLLAAIFDEGWGNLSEALRLIQGLPSPGTKLQSLIDLLLTRLEEDDELKQLLLFESRRIRTGGRMVLLSAGFLDLVRTLDGFLAEMRNAGQLRADLDIQAVRSALIGSLEGLLRDQVLSQRFTYPASYSSGDIRTVFLDILKSFLISAKV